MELSSAAAVQRAEETRPESPAEVESSQSPVEASAAAPVPVEAGSAEQRAVDVQELANQVYAVLRRRLVVERERLG
jgi:hypothetical protein